MPISFALTFLIFFGTISVRNIGVTGKTILPKFIEEKYSKYGARDMNVSLVSYSTDDKSYKVKVTFEKPAYALNGTKVLDSYTYNVYKYANETHLNESSHDSAITLGPFELSKEKTEFSIDGLVFQAIYYLKLDLFYKQEPIKHDYSEFVHFKVLPEGSGYRLFQQKNSEFAVTNLRLALLSCRNKDNQTSFNILVKYDNPFKTIPGYQDYVNGLYIVLSAINREMEARRIQLSSQHQFSNYKINRVAPGTEYEVAMYPVFKLGGTQLWDYSTSRAFITVP